MELFKTKTHIEFLGKRRYAYVLSAILLVLSLVVLAIRGLNFGIDFTGGTLIEVSFPGPTDTAEVRSTLQKAGFGEVVVQHFGTARDVIVRLAPRPNVSQSQLSNQVLDALRQAHGQDLQLRRVEFVGPQVGAELAEKGGIAMLVVVGAILLYVGMRFEWRLGVGAIAALAHDPIITLGLFALFRIEFDLTALAAVLAVIGYSINDTIVVFDRIRETFRKLRRGSPLEVMNTAINETLSRTIMTSGTTAIVVLALLGFGGELLHSFSLALLIGIVVGTYSSIYVASAMALDLGLSRRDLMPVKKEGAEADARP